MGVDLAAVTGSGPGGRIVEADIVAAAGPAEAAGPVALSPLRRTIAERMLKSWRAVPHFTLETEVDMEAAARFRDAHPGPEGKPFTWNDLVVAAAGRALEAFEGLRRRWEGETLVAVPGSGLGVAVHTDEGLVVPVVRDAGRKTLSALAAEIREKAARARAGRLAPEDLHPAAMTVTNLGMFGVTRFVPVVNHPECSILAVGKVEDRIRARDAWFGVRPVMALNLALDHRALDGGLGARFLAHVKAILEEADFRR
jgi:pyruvate dehydrogenase E2 component (dihydrolipoamide acetyltransferase)